MATFHKTQKMNYTTAVVLFLFIIFTSKYSFSAARVLNDELGLSNGLQASTEPTFNLALPADVDNSNNKNNNYYVFDTSEQDPKPQVLPCDHMVPIKNSHVGMFPRSAPRLTGKYGPMILSMLPKGPSKPPSGPSKGTNQIKN